MWGGIERGRGGSRQVQKHFGFRAVWDTGQRTPGAAPGVNSAIPSRKGFPWGETGPIWPPTCDLENNSLATGSRALYPEAMAKPQVIL